MLPPDAFVCASPLVIDDFTSSSPCSPWGTLSGTNGATASEGNGALTFTLPPSSSAKCASTPIAVPFGGFEIDVGQLPAGTQSSVSLLSNALDVALYIYGNYLNLSPVTGTNPTKVQYVADQMRFLRLVPQSDNTIVGMYSADGNAWTSISPPLSVPAFPAAIDVTVKANGNATITSTAVFQLVVACP